MSILSATIIILIIILFIMTLSSIITNMSSYKYYKKTYKVLDEQKWKILVDSIVNFDTYSLLNENEEIIFFGDNSVKLIGNCKYIHAGFPFCLDLYSLYWSFKFRKYFKNLKKLNQWE